MRQHRCTCVWLSGCCAQLAGCLVLLAAGQDTCAAPTALQNARHTGAGMCCLTLGKLCMVEALTTVVWAVQPESSCTALHCTQIFVPYTKRH